MKASPILVSAGILIATCGAAQPVVTGGFMHGGILREYRLYVPNVYNPATPVPLVLNLHGYTSSNTAQELYGDFRAIADTANFIIAHPNGTLDANNQRYWNTFGASQVDDLGFLTALIDTISARYAIDPDRVYSTGMSNGGFMSYDLACFRSQRIAAIASVTGTMANARLASCAAAHPTPVMQVHGTADPTVPYAGGNGMVAVEDLVDHWARFNNCVLPAVITPVPDIDPTDGCTAEHWVFQGGDRGSTVELFKVLGGGHTWPGAPFSIGVTNRDFNASIEIWRFFSKYRLRDLVAGIPGHGPDQGFSAYPNPTTGDFNLRFADAGAKRITVNDALGRVVHLANCACTETAVRIDGPGSYYVTVEEGDRRWTRRMVKL